MDPIMFPDEIPLPTEEIPLPPDDIPLPPDDIPIPPDEVPLPPDDIPLPPDNIPLPPDEFEPVTSHLNRQQKRPSSPAQDPRPKKPRTEDSKKNKKAKKSKPQLQGTDERPTEEQIMMARVMGFSSFNSTKGKMVPDNQRVGAVHVIKKQRCRQYMNRKGGFNRPLDKTS